MLYFIHGASLQFNSSFHVALTQLLKKYWCKKSDLDGQTLRTFPLETGVF